MLSDLLIPSLMEHCLRFINLWPEHSNIFAYPLFASLIISSLVFQFWDTLIVYKNLELLTLNISYLILITLLSLRMTTIWKQRWCVKEVLSEMLKDWNNAKYPEEKNIMNKYVQFSHKFFAFAFFSYNLTMILFLVPAFWTYFAKSAENRLFPIPASFPFSTKTSPNYEIIVFAQSILLLLIGIIFSTLDATFVIMVLHASAKLEILKLTLDDLLNEIMKSEDRLSIKVLIKRHLNAIQFVKKVSQIFSQLLFFHIIFTILQFCFMGFIYLKSLSESFAVSTLLKNTLFLCTVFFEILTYCTIGELLQTKSNLVAVAAYLLPWHDLKSSEAKTLMMFIQRAQKPLSISAGKLITISHFTFINILKLSASYLSVLRAVLA